MIRNKILLKKVNDETKMLQQIINGNCPAAFRVSTAYTGKKLGRRKNYCRHLDMKEREVKKVRSLFMMRKKGTVSGRTEITIRFNQTAGIPLNEVLEEIWNLKEEHPDVKINIEVNR